MLFFIIFGGTLLLSLAASGYVKLAFRRAHEVPISSGITGAEIARRILRHSGVDEVEVVEHQGFLSDHYNPMTKTLALSPDVYHGRSAAAAGVAAHEVGHALQHAHGDVTMWARSVLAPAAYFGGSLGPYIVMAGGLLGGAQAALAGHQTLGYWILVIGVVLFGLATLMSLVTVPNEFNASSRARVALLDMGYIRQGEEDAAVRSVLTAAGLTYVAAAISSIAWLLYYALPLIMGRRDEE